MNSISRFPRCLGTLFFLLSISLPLLAGGGTVHQAGGQQGNIDFTAYFRFPPDEDTLNRFKLAIAEASAIICQATEGQIRIGVVTITGGSTVNQDLADMWIHPEKGQANANMCFLGPGFPCYGLEIPGARTNIYVDRSHSLFFEPLTIAHELGHLALDLGDEYDKQNYQGTCWGIGPCIEAGQADNENNCIMQKNSLGDGFGYPSELCVEENHDPLRGDPATPACTDPTMLACPPPCDFNCQNWNPNTCRYETTMHTNFSHTKLGAPYDCWSHLDIIHPFVTPPDGLPSAETSECDEPTFVDAIEAIDQVVLVLDRSWSMRLLPGQGPCVGPGCPEICDNTLDDDGDGNVDESFGCQEGRLSFLQNSAKLFLSMVKGGAGFDPITTDAGLMSFSCSTTDLTGGLEPVGNQSLPNLFAPLIDGLVPNGNTAIGDALGNAAGLFPSGADLSPNRAIFLITDGLNNCGSWSPGDMANLLDALGTRVYIVTTEGGNDDLLGTVAEATMGRLLQTEKSTDLMPAIALQAARYLNRGLLIPKLSYRIASTGQFENAANARGSNAWFNNEFVPKGTDPSTPPTLQSNIFEFYVEEGTSQVNLNFAGDMSSMAHFGIRARLQGPNGRNPRSFDSEAAPNPLFRVTREDFFTLLTLRNPNPGLWRVQLTSTDAIGPGHHQTGFVTVLSENKRAQLATSLNRHVLNAPNDGDVLLSAFPSFDTDLRDAVIRAKLYRPDGTVVNLPVEDNTHMNAGYLIRVQQTPLAGQYEIRLHMETQPGLTSNHPGEPIFENMPSVTTVVPKLVRTAVETFVVQEEHIRK